MIYECMDIIIYHNPTNPTNPTNPIPARSLLVGEQASKRVGNQLQMARPNKELIPIWLYDRCTLTGVIYTVNNLL